MKEKNDGWELLGDERQDIFEGYGECDPNAPDGPVMPQEPLGSDTPTDEQIRIDTALIPLRSRLSIILQRNTPLTLDDVNSIMCDVRSSMAFCREMNEPH